jgi:hypothetical protein
MPDPGQGIWLTRVDTADRALGVNEEGGEIFPALVASRFAYHPSG